MPDKQIDDLVGRAEQAWMSFCDADGKETMEMAEPRDLFQMGFNSGVRAALERQREGFSERQIFDRAIDMLNDMHKRIGFKDVDRMMLHTRLADRIAQEHMQKLQDDLLAAPEPHTQGEWDALSRFKDDIESLGKSLDDSPEADHD